MFQYLPRGRPRTPENTTLRRRLHSLERTARQWQIRAQQLEQEKEMMRVQNVIIIPTLVKCKGTFRNEHSQKCNFIHLFVPFSDSSKIQMSLISR